MIEHLVTNPKQLERDFVESKGIFRWFGEPRDAGCICLIKEGLGWSVYDNHGREIPDFISRIVNDPGLHSWDGLHAAWQGCKTEDERRALLQPYVQVQKEYDDLCNARKHDEQKSVPSMEEVDNLRFLINDVQLPPEERIKAALEACDIARRAIASRGSV